MSMLSRTSAKPVRTSVKDDCQNAVIGMKQSKSKDSQVEYVGSMHGNLFSYVSDDGMTRQAASDRHENVHDCSYTAGVPLLAHGFSVNL